MFLSAALSEHTTSCTQEIYHITHLDNLEAIWREGQLISDAEMIRRGGPEVTIGMSDIKRRRVEVLSVPCYPGTKVGDYVPFYFCPRSIMLYVISCRNHPELAYTGGQEPIVHLEVDLHTSLRWLDEDSRPWAFSLSNAGARYTRFHKELRQMDQLNWDAIMANDWRQEEVEKLSRQNFLALGAFQFI